MWSMFFGLVDFIHILQGYFTGTGVILRLAKILEKNYVF